MAMLNRPPSDLDYILILGMHRSGTSLLGHLIADLGYSIGRSPLPPAPDNPEGYYENLDIVIWHEVLLDRMSSSWCDVHSLPPEWWTADRLQEAASDLASLLEVEFSGESRRLIKDPRMCRLMVPWLHHLESTGTARVRYLLALRSPWQVARSLQARDGFSLHYGLLLWIQHALAAERSTRGQERLLIGHDQLLSGRASPDLAKFLGLNLDDVSTHLHRVANPSLHHQRQASLEADSGHPVHELAGRVWQLFSEACIGGTLDQSGLDSSWEAFQELQRIIPPDFNGRSTSPEPPTQQSALFMDRGAGFSESSKITASMMQMAGRFCVEFRLPESSHPLLKLRWDPLEGEWCRLLVSGIFTDKGSLTAAPTNCHHSEEGMDVFQTVDPIYSLEGDVNDVRKVTIRGRLEIIPRPRDGAEVC